MIIYKATNLINNKHYIGQTTKSLNTRKSQHKRTKNTYFSKAIRKYGLDNFSWEILCECNDLTELNYKESLYINLFQSNQMTKGYNLTTGGFNFKMSEETKRKISSANKGKPKSEEHTKKNSESHKGQIAWNKGIKGVIKDSEETKKKKSESNKGKHKNLNQIPWNKGLKGAQSAWNKGVPRTDETKEKIRQTNKGRIPWNKGLKGAQVAWNKGLKKSKKENV